ncbi:HNH endonuclease [Streptomyces uncialis]|uniref:HNH endonuclease n=1 Tax=Streptomyces uncialis TaxID=1048205 RepID=UPI003866E201|nr:HNH endonuclease [Streptomyces uncialis]
MVLPSPRDRYSEAAHIQAREDKGPDVIENLLCLCPNCHVLFDAGARVLTDDLTIVDTTTGRPGPRIVLHRWHFIAIQDVRHHRRRWTGRPEVRKRAVGTTTDLRPPTASTSPMSPRA